MQIGNKQRPGSWTLRWGATIGISRSFLAGIATASIVHAVSAPAAVIEFFNPDLNNYFITAEPVEQDFIDTGAVGLWQRTGNAFATGGPNQVCRFYGSLSPGPNSHFYTADSAECAALRQVQATTPASQKRWNFESNDFLTTPAVNGTCPAGLAPIYRAYNNGFVRGIDSNHRITGNRTAYLETVAAGSIGEGVVMCAPPGNALPTATAVGVADGTATTATIGATGGGVSTPDGKIRLTIPAGALAADTVIGVQPITNLAHGKIGAAYRLTPESQTFLKPITITFAFTDEDLEGTNAEFLGVAFQTADGFWQWAGDAIVDGGAKTVSVASTRFSGIAGSQRSWIADTQSTKANPFQSNDWSNVRGIQIRPPRKTLKPNASVGLEVKVCYAIDYGGLATLGSDCEHSGQGIVASLSINEWSVNGVPGGVPDRFGRRSVFGTVNGRDATATYKAPATEPTPNTVAVSARVHNPKKGPAARTLVVSNITITDDSWTGTGTNVYVSEDSQVTITADVTWTLESSNNGVSTYVPTGTVTESRLLTDDGCAASLNPSSHAIDPSIDGTLTIDFNADPPTYHGHGQSVWVATATITCPDTPTATTSTLAGSAFLGGRGGDAVGIVSPDGNTIHGSDSYTPAAGFTFNFTWNFTRDQ